MSSTHTRLAAACLTIATCLAGMAGASPALASTAPIASSAPTGEDQQPVAFPVDFVDLPTRSLPPTGRAHTFTVTYRNEASADQVVAPQILVQSPDSGPYLNPSDIKVERRTTDGCWKAVPLGSQTGTLFTDLSAAQHTLHRGDTLIERYRLTVITPDAKGMVQPRVALYN